MRVRGNEGAKVEGEKEGCENRERTSTRHASGPPTVQCTKSRMRSYLLMTPKAYGRTDGRVNFKRREDVIVWFLSIVLFIKEVSFFF